MTEALPWRTAESLGPGLRAGEISPVELTVTMLERIAAFDPELRSYARVDADAALQAAERAAAELRSGRDRGPLHGVPLAVKDLCAMRGECAAAGTIVLRDRIAERDAWVVERLREGGAVILGSLSMTEGAYAAHHPSIPPPRNPWDPGRWSGVSSSGSGVAVAAGLCVTALGTDTGGSIRFPSACNGVVGLKPTYGRVSRRGIFPLAASLDHVGPIARSSADAAMVLSVISGFDPEELTSLRSPPFDGHSRIDAGIADVRIGVDETFANEEVDPAIVKPILAQAEIFRAAGAELRAVRMPPWHDVVSGWTPLCAAEAALAHEGLFPERAKEYGPELRGLLELGRALDSVELARLEEQRRVFRGALAGLFEEIDLLLCPTLGIPVPPAAPELVDPSFVLRFTAPFDYSGSPTLSLPCGFAPDGLPLSLQLVARPLEEELLCRAGRAYEDRTEWHRHHPPVGAERS